MPVLVVVPVEEAAAVGAGVLVAAEAVREARPGLSVLNAASENDCRSRRAAASASGHAEVREGSASDLLVMALPRSAWA